jgi:hypothetical protein
MCNRTDNFLFEFRKPAGGRNPYELSNATVVHTIHNTPYTNLLVVPSHPGGGTFLIITLIQLDNLDSDRTVMHGCDSFSRFYAFFSSSSSSAGKAETNRAETKTFF